MKVGKALVIASFVFSALAALWMLFEFRAELGIRRPAHLAGELILEESPELKSAITGHLEERARRDVPDASCSHAMLGRDRAFVYIEYTCGDADLTPARLEIKPGNRVARMDEAAPEESLEFLFPPEIRERMTQP